MHWNVCVMGPVFFLQSIVSLTYSLSICQLHYQIHSYLLLEKVRIFCNKRSSTFFNEKNHIVLNYVIHVFTFEINNETLNNDFVNFEQPARGRIILNN